MYTYFKKNENEVFLFPIFYRDSIWSISTGTTALDFSGNTIATEYNNNRIPYINVYFFNGNTWIQKGNTILNSMSPILSSDGNYLLCGEYQDMTHFYVTLYEYNNITHEWINIFKSSSVVVNAFFRNAFLSNDGNKFAFCDLVGQDLILYLYSRSSSGSAYTFQNSFSIYYNSMINASDNLDVFVSFPYNSPNNIEIREYENNTFNLIGSFAGGVYKHIYATVNKFKNNIYAAFTYEYAYGKISIYKYVSGTSWNQLYTLENTYNISNNTWIVSAIPINAKRIYCPDNKILVIGDGVRIRYNSSWEYHKLPYVSGISKDTTCIIGDTKLQYYLL